MSILPASTAAVAALLMVGPVPASAEGPPQGPALTFPDGAGMTMPPLPGAPGAAARAPAAGPQGGGAGAEQSPQGGPATASERRRQRLDELFGRLAGAQDAPEAVALGAAIDSLWLQSGSPTADLLMQRVARAMVAKNDKTAGLLLDKIIALRPGWAEAWNKRATVRYLQDDDPGSMEDISHVLALEPRHFGALSGMGFIFHRNGDDKAALVVLRKASAINPQQPDIKALIEQLAPEVDGHDL